jgi:hypothetical protein
MLSMAFKALALENDKMWQKDVLSDHADDGALVLTTRQPYDFK